MESKIFHHLLIEIKLHSLKEGQFIFASIQPTITNILNESRGQSNTVFIS